ncbi:hypothetical protein [Chromohalobacter sp.]|uniref:hypothetical protein n=1 Tax=Chromohalobacter sp. TaxID=50740 RepID=UPI002587C661|nr:hypothetical protein [Chromohalobacter sp.]MCI0510002.1 hypothetical protein [Chromohalobacter sp.]
MTLAFALHLVWEVAHLPLYTLAADGDRVRIALYVLHCTLGDVLIATTTFLAPALGWRRFDWYRAQPLAGSVVMIGLAVSYTAASEWFNVYYRAAWAYAPSMPTIGGIGVTPLLQWIVVPVLIVVAMRRWSPGRDRGQV